MNELLKSSNNGTYVIYFNSVSSLTSITLNIDKNEFVTDTYKYSYSTDDSTWSPYVIDSATFITNVTALNLTVPIFIRIEVTLIHARKSHYQLSSVSINGADATNNGIEMLNNTEPLNNNVNQSKIFRPFNVLDDAHKLRTTICDSFIEHVGETCKYYRVRPNMETAQYTLKTFEDSSVFDMKEMLVTFKDGQKPDNRPVETEWSSEYDDIIEIEILKTQFTKIFGADQLPSDKDFLYLNFDKRLYEINTVYEKRDMYNKSVMWVAILVKYEENANIDKGVYKDDITDFAEYTDDAYIDNISDEVKDATGENDDINFNVSLEDDVNEPTIGLRKNRLKSYDPKLNIVQVNKTNNGVVYMDYMIHSIATDMISYNLSMIDTTYSVVFWFKLDAVNDNNIFKLYDGNTLIGEMYVNDSKKIAVKFIQGTNTQFIIPTQANELKKNSLYGIVMNKSANNSTISIVDDNLTSLGQILTVDTYTYTNPTSITFSGGGLNIGNIRVFKDIITSSNINTTLITKNVLNKECELLVNVSPQTKNKLKTN